MKKKKKTANKYFSLLVLARLSLRRILSSSGRPRVRLRGREFYISARILRYIHTIHTISILLLLLLLRSAALKVYTLKFECVRTPPPARNYRRLAAPPEIQICAGPCYALTTPPPRYIYYYYIGTYISKRAFV